MLALLKSYSIGDIIIFRVILALAVKEVISLYQYFAKGLSDSFNNKYKKQETLNDLSEKINKLTIMVKQLQEDNKQQNKKIENLIDSDVQDIRSWIVQQYHACQQGKQLDPFEMDCVERRYACYDKEGGNSYIHNLVDEIRKMNNSQEQEK